MAGGRDLQNRDSEAFIPDKTDFRQCRVRALISAPFTTPPDALAPRGPWGPVLTLRPSAHQRVLSSQPLALLMPVCGPEDSLRTAVTPPCPFPCSPSLFRKCQTEAGTRRREKEPTAMSLGMYLTSPGKDSDYGTY